MPFNLRSPETQATLDIIPQIATAHANTHALAMWNKVGPQTPCPWVTFGEPVSHPALIVAIKNKEIAAWSCCIILKGGWECRVLSVTHNGIQVVEVVTGEVRRSQCVTIVQAAGTNRILKWFNNKWMNAS